MKYNILAAVVAGALLSACNNGSSTQSLQAYDPAIKNMSVSYQCGDDDAIKAPGYTNGNGYIYIDDDTVINDPELCEFTFTGDTDVVDEETGLTGAFDTSNKKSMNTVTYVVPKGLAEAGGKVTASPLTTLIAKALGDEIYTEDSSIVTGLISSLGLNGIIGSVSPSDLLLDTETFANSLTGTDDDGISYKATLLATTAALSDTIKNTITDVTATAIAEATATYSKKVTEEYPDYPETGTDGVVASISFDESADTINGYTDDQLEESVSTSVIEVTIDTDDSDDATGTGTGTGGSTSTSGN